MSLQNTHAVILCGGLGTRLRGVIGESQKTMAEIDGVPFLDIIVEYLNRQGIDKIILSAGYKSEIIKKHYGSHAKLHVLKVIEEFEPLGTAGALNHPETKALIKSDPFFVLNGDSFCQVNLAQFLNSHLKLKAQASIVASLVEDASDYGTVEFDKDGRVTGFHEKKAGVSKKYVNAGVYCFNQSIFDLISGKSSLEKNIFPQLVNKQTLFAYPVKEIFYDIGTPERLREAPKVLKRKKDEN